MEFLKLESALTDMKYSIDELSSRLEMIEESVNLKVDQEQLSKSKSRKKNTGENQNSPVQRYHTF